MKSLSTRFLDQSKDLGKCEKVLIDVGKKAPVDLTRTNYEELDGLQCWQLWVVQHKGNVIEADHLPLMKANQNVTFLEASACGNAFRADIQNQQTAMQLGVRLAYQVAVHALDF